jgi:hypothetical protein
MLMCSYMCIMQQLCSGYLLALRTSRLQLLTTLLDFKTVLPCFVAGNLWNSFRVSIIHV